VPIWKNKKFMQGTKYNLTSRNVEPALNDNTVMQKILQHTNKRYKTAKENVL
jgi:hypothetical protein